MLCEIDVDPWKPEVERLVGAWLVRVREGKLLNVIRAASSPRVRSK
jgi:hypothetical protein